MKNLLLGALWCALSTNALAASSLPTHRHALIVGANRGAAGRGDLRYAHDDARSVAATLSEVGNFSPSDVTVLTDPDPQAVLAAMDSTLATLAREGGESVFVFYYSGHADNAALYPNGKPLPLTQVRERLDRQGATVRVGILDACRGGSWTRAKGLTRDAPFEVDVPFELASQGAVLIASSSGEESAHESDALRGSFFTHHLLAGMRGAADNSRDGEVTVAEAFEYAKALTIRDTALAAAQPQHPSFDMHLRGRSDLALTRVDNSRSVVALAQSQGPLQVVNLKTGIVVLELPEGERTLQLAIPPGRYLVRRRDDSGVYARELSVDRNASVTLDEASLRLVGKDSLEAKEVVQRPIPSGPGAREMEIRTAIGMSGAPAPGFGIGSPGADNGVFGGFVTSAQFLWGITDRFTVGFMAPSLGYRFGERGGTELFLAGGTDAFGLGFSNVESTIVTFGLFLSSSLRFAVTDNSAFTLYTGARSDAQYSALRQFAPTTWSFRVAGTFSINFGSRLTLHLTAQASKPLVVERQARGLRPSDDSALFIGVGGNGMTGLRVQRLLEVRVTDTFSIEGDATFGALIKPNEVAPSVNVMLGAAWLF